MPGGRRDSRVSTKLRVGLERPRPRSARRRRQRGSTRRSSTLRGSFDRTTPSGLGDVPGSASRAPHACLRFDASSRAGCVRRSGHRYPGPLFEPQRRAELGRPLVQALLKLARPRLHQRLSRVHRARAAPRVARDPAGAVLPSGCVAERTSRIRRWRARNRLTSSMSARPSEPLRSESESSTTVSGASEIAWVKYWMVEFFCDLFAVYTLGPAFVWRTCT